MELEITPRPTPDERAAIVQALVVAAPLAALRGAWWLEGIHENAIDPADGEDFTPTSSDR